MEKNLIENKLASQILFCITLVKTLIPGSSAVEQTTVNRLAGGSNPSRGATFLLSTSVHLALNPLSRPFRGLGWLMKTRTSKTIIRSLLVGINNGVLVAICFYLIVSEQLAFEERAIYAMSAAIFWMGIQRIIKKSGSANESNNN